MVGRLDPAEVARFSRDLFALTGAPPARLGVAVSGGPDSLALLLLAAAAFPGQVEAATVDHGLRAESAAEAEAVAAICADLNVPHEILRIDWPEMPAGNIQAEARERRYAALGKWAAARGLRDVATGHHADDQAETVLMRLSRGSGIAGLSGIRPMRWEGGMRILRPLLSWSRADLHALAHGSGFPVVDDPSNRSDAHDRTLFRALLSSTDLLPAASLAAAAANLRDAEELMKWADAVFWRQHVSFADGEAQIDDPGLPFELLRRLTVKVIDSLRGEHGIEGNWRTDKLPDVIARAAADGRATIAEILIRSKNDGCWRLTLAPPRRRAPPR